MNKIIEFNILPFASLNLPINQLSIDLAIGSLSHRAKSKAVKQIQNTESLFFIFVIFHLTDHSHRPTRLRSPADRSCICMFATRLHAGSAAILFLSAKAQ